jgi:uncharacterized phage protein (TIGR01671 family)
MKREILFRGKRTDGNGWAYGAYIPQSSEIATFDAEAQDCTIPVNEDTVGEYTGLTDKHLKRIFEGDIVEYVGVGWDDPEMTRAEVIWCGCDGGWGTTEGQDYCPDALTAPDAERMTVIGNIYDNPELLNSEGTARNEQEHNG